MTAELRLSYLLHVNSDLFLNATAGISEADAVRRPNRRVNNIAFLAAHLVDVRHYLASAIGIDQPNPVAGLLANARGIDDIPQLPTLVQLRTAWQESRW